MTYTCGNAEFPDAIHTPMTDKVRLEIAMVGPKQFPRCVIINGCDKRSHQPTFWNGRAWVTGLQGAMLFADIDTAHKELLAIRGRS